MWPDASETQTPAAPCCAGRSPRRPTSSGSGTGPRLRRMIGLRLDQAVSRRVDASDVVQDVLDQGQSSGWRSISAILRCRFISGCVRSRGTMSLMHTGGIACRPGAAWIASGDCTPRALMRSFDDRSSLDLAAQLSRLGAHAGRPGNPARASVPIFHPFLVAWKTAIARSSCSATSSSFPTARPPRRWA